MWQIFLEELLLVAADFSLRVLKNRRLKPAATSQYKSITYVEVWEGVLFAPHLS